MSKAGRHGPFRESHEPRLMARGFVADGVTIPTGFHPFDATKGITDWGMDNNDQYGCCGFSAWDHANIAKLGDRTLEGLTFSPAFATLLDAYWAYGIAQGEPGPHPDDGVDNASMLAWGYRNGLIYGYGEVDDEEMDWFAQTFQGVLTGQLLDENADQDFEANPKIPWGTNPNAKPNPQDGHDTLYISSPGDGSGVTVTWGGLQPFTATYRTKNITDRWVIFNQNDPFVNHDALLSALEAVHGTVHA